MRSGIRDDLVGYEVLLRFIEGAGLWELPGDILEIGAFLGGGTVKLAKAADRHHKMVHVIDCFDPQMDPSRTIRGESLSWFYSAILAGRDPRALFQRKTRGLKNIVLYDQDSRKVALRSGAAFVFSIVDGNHTRDAVESDFSLAWTRTVPGGAVAFHDYRGDFPEVTVAIDKIKGSIRAEIGRETQIERQRLIIFEKRLAEVR
jgi:hypothetical protein